MRSTAEKALETARVIGEADGENAASWWEQDAVGGRFTGDAGAVARRVLRMFEEGDPAIYDSIPSADLSGEWADGMTPQRLADECGLVDDDCSLEMQSDLLDGCCAEYEQAFADACEAEIIRLCKLVIE